METYKKNNHPLSQCYFCGEEMLPNYLEMHVKHCGCVLEPCPESCGLYVQRQYKNHHSNWCKKGPSKQFQLATIQTELMNLKQQLKQEVSERKLQVQDVLVQLERCYEKITQAELLNTTLVESAADIQKLLAEEQSSRFKDVADLSSSTSTISKLVNQLKFTLNQTRVDVEELINDTQSGRGYKKFMEQFVEEWKLDQDKVLSNMKATLNKNINAEINELHKDNIIRSKSVSDLLDLNEVIIDTQDKYTEQIYQLEEEVKGFQKFLAEENILVSDIWREQLNEVKKLNTRFDENDNIIQVLIEGQKLVREKVERFEHFSKEINNVNLGSENNKILDSSLNESLIKELIVDRNSFRERLESLETMGKNEIRNLSTSSMFEENILGKQNDIVTRLEHLETLTADIKSNSSETDSTPTKHEHCELSVIVNELRSEQTIIKRRLESLEILTQELEEAKCKLNKNVILRDEPTVSINGRLMWTISNFDKKLEDGKQTHGQIESPYFYTSESGYKLQMRAYLNGIGQWEGRHMIISLHMLSSRWDAQLTWPCRLKVIICLRDQEQVHRKAKDVVKSFTSSPAKMGSESPCLRMFIPHRVLYTRNYLKHNVIIIEIKAFPV